MVARAARVSAEVGRPTVQQACGSVLGAAPLSADAASRAVDAPCELQVEILHPGLVRAAVRRSRVLRCAYRSIVNAKARIRNLPTPVIDSRHLGGGRYRRSALDAAGAKRRDLGGPRRSRLVRNGPCVHRLLRDSRSSGRQQCDAGHVTDSRNGSAAREPVPLRTDSPVRSCRRCDHWLGVVVHRRPTAPQGNARHRHASDCRPTSTMSMPGSSGCRLRLRPSGAAP